MQRALFRRQKALIEQSVQGYSASFRAYEATYKRHVHSYHSVMAYVDLVTRVNESDLVYVGDYHTLKQAQRAFAKLIDRVAGRQRPVIIALEFVQGRFQRHLDDFMRGRIGEETFLTRIDYANHQVFGVWDNFKRIFDVCRARDLPVLALDLVQKNAGLAQRDGYAAERLARSAAENPGAIHLVLVGQLHCAPPHLPEATRQALSRRGLSVRDLVVYQNAEEVYFQLERAGLEHVVEAVEIADRELCLINTSPVVAQQSYLDWLEGDGEQVEATAPERHFKDLARVIADFLDLDIGDALDAVEVYTAGDLSFLTRLRASGQFDRKEIATIKRQILARESYYIPKNRVVYLANLSVNHAAEEAAHFLRHHCSKEEDPHGLIDSFYSRAVNEAVAFYGSKIINPRRKCAHEEEWERRSRGPDGFEKQVGKMVCAHLALERGERRRGLIGRIYGHEDAEVFNAVTHSLGYILGDRLYYGMLKGRIAKAEIRDYFFDPFDEEGAAFHAYFHLAGKVAKVRVPRHS